MFMYIKTDDFHSQDYTYIGLYSQNTYQNKTSFLNKNLISWYKIRRCQFFAFLAPGISEGDWAATGFVDEQSMNTKSHF